MELNRNQFFMIGIVLFVLGLQVKFVDSYVLTEDAASFVAKRISKPSAPATGAVTQSFASMSTAAAPAGKRTIHPPQWLGWALMSIGAVMILHSLAMPKPSS
ncbi:MAG: hypothetical protein KDA41_01495 [Planctomycetales bacterium]|nr:hypothetical protein [Planctomycetales bacterium]